jgi:Tol biopolymer transport system component
VKFAPAFSPDGAQVSFAWDGGVPGRSDIYAKSVGAGEPRRLTTSGGGASAWSPDGSWIAFLRRETAGDFAVILVPPTGGTERPVARIRTSIVVPDLRLAWSADSRWLVLPDLADGGGSQYLVLVSIATGEKRRLTFPPPGEVGDASPAWSPAGNLLAFARHKDIKVSDLYVLSLTDAYEVIGQPRQLTNDSHWSDHPAWGPGGRDLIYVSDSEQRRALWRIPVREHGKRKRLSFLEPAADEPAVSPHGGRLAFVRRRTDSNLWIAQLSGPSGAPSQPARFATSSEDEHSPAFSPLGDRVAFISNRSGRDEVWVCRRDGSGASQLTSMGKSAWPQWSRDGRTIVFSSEAPDGARLYAISATGGQPRRLTSGNAHDCMPVYSVDGRWIYFASNREDGFQLWKMPSAGGDPVRVTRHGGHAVKESPDGAMLYYTREHTASTSLWRVPVNGGEESPVAKVVLAEAFSPAASGVYYLTRSEASGRASIEFRDAAGVASTLLCLPEGIAARGLSFSPDNKAVLYSIIQGMTTDLMLVDNFR